MFTGEFKNSFRSPVDEEKQWAVEPGDVIHIGPGERHWHGAAEGHNMTHISVTTVGSPIWEDHAPDL